MSKWDEMFFKKIQKAFIYQNFKFQLFAYFSGQLHATQTKPYERAQVGKKFFVEPRNTVRIIWNMKFKFRTCFETFPRPIRQCSYAVYAALKKHQLE